MFGSIVSRAPLLRSLHDPRAFAHPVDRVAIIETHLSWVLLAGEYAYKIKKPVKLPFVDFGTLAARRFYCAEEVRLNRRTAPDLYVGVVPIAGNPPSPGGEGEPLEYAVKMRRFAQDNLLAARARAGTLEASTVDNLAARVAALHEGADVAPPDSPAHSAELAARPALDNFAEIRAIESRTGPRARLAVLERWTEEQGRKLAPVFAERRSQGFVRECHGDLHLANVVLIGGAPVLFDALEFNVRLRWCDVMSDVAFMAMDLAHHDKARLAARFVNAYLERTGDYEGLRVLRFYQVYRAMVRAKVDRIRAEHARGAPRRQALASFEEHLALARELAVDTPPALVAMHGPSGAGKTHASQRLLEALGAVRLRSDVERKRMHGIVSSSQTASAPGEGIYSRGEGRRTYARLAALAQSCLEAGIRVVVDATCLERSQRDLFEGVALRARVPFRIVSCGAPLAVMRERVRLRARAGRDASEAGLAVLRLQLASQQRLGADEMGHVLVLDTADASACGASLEAFARILEVSG